MSILFADALKSAGIPARVAGTPAWNGQIEIVKIKKLKCLFLFEGDPESGNHNWIEVFDHRYVFLVFFLHSHMSCVFQIPGVAFY